MKVCLRYDRVIAAAVTLALQGLAAGCQIMSSQSSTLSDTDARIQNPAYRMRPLQLKHGDGSLTAVRIWTPGDGKEPVADVFVIGDGLPRNLDNAGNEALSLQWIEYLGMRWATAGFRVIDFDFSSKVTEQQRFFLATEVLRRTAEDDSRKVLLVGAGKGANEVAQILVKSGQDVSPEQRASLGGVLLMDPPRLEDLRLPLELPLFVAAGSAEQEAVVAVVERAVVRLFEDESRGGGILLCRGRLFGDDGVNPFYLLASVDFLLNPSGFDGDGAQRSDPKKACRFVQHPLR